jgi:hypothetical protein
VPPQAVEPASDPLTILIDYCRTKDVGYGGWTATHAAALVSLQGRTSQIDEMEIAEIFEILNVLRIKGENGYSPDVDDVAKVEAFVRTLLESR